MKKKIKIFLIVFITVITIFSSINFMNINVSYANQEKSLINISECSTSFMSNYFEESKEIKESDNKDNILIVTSESKIRDVEGASKIVAAPNNQYILQYDSKEEKEEALESFSANKKIISVEENTVYTISETKFNSWGIEKTGLDQAIDVAKNSGLNNITVAIIDTGCNMDLFNQNYSGKIVETYNVLDSNDTMYDNNGHGTHIAGTIAEGTPDNVKILPIKVSDNGTLYNTDIIEAINYIVHYNKADVINMSFGSYSSSQSIYQAISAANEKNIISVVAAGNDNTSAKNYPAAYDNTISVSSVDSNLNKSTFSNYGSTITFAAPGTDILSINGTKSGTSMATPHVVCAAAILKSYNKNYTLEDTIEILNKYAVDLGDVGRDNYFGNGLINFKGITYCDCNCENCDNIYCSGCTCLGCIFNEEITMVKKIEVPYPLVTTYNYGSITNLSETQIRIYYDDENYFTKNLLDLNGCEITGYDPYCYTNQTITVKYKGQETTFEINKGEDYESGWEYEVISEDEKTIQLTKYKKSNGVTKIYVPSTIDGYTVTTLGEILFFQAEIDTAILPETVSTIGTKAFYYSGLKNIDIKSEEIAIGDHAFWKLEYIKGFNSKITSLGDYAFDGCSMLNKVYLADKLESIGVCAFRDCSNLESIEIPESVKSIGATAFYGTNLKNIIIPDGVTKIEKETFADCLNLESVTIPESVTEIGSYAFSYCNNLRSLTIPKNVSTIATDSFQYCSGLDTIVVDEANGKYDSRDNCNALIETESNTLLLGSYNTVIPSSVKIIGNLSFGEIVSLTKLVIPEGVEKIESYAFEGCNYLEEITIPKSVTEIGTKAIVKSTIDSSLPIVMVYKNSAGETYAKDNNLNYKVLDASITRSKIYLEKTDYRAFEEVDTTGMYIRLWFDDDTVEDITEGFTIKYSGENTSFRYGDTYFTVSAYSQTGQYIEKEVTVTVNKAVPQYNEPTGLKAIEGQYLFQIELPDGFEWMDAGQLIEGYGDLGFRIRYIPQDTNNYLTIDNIIIILSVRSSKHDAVGVTYRTNSYKAFETVNTDEIHLTIQYNDGIVETIKEGLNIEYPNGNTSFRYGDTYYTVSAYSELGELVTAKVNVTVSKVIPQYTTPTGITAKVGQLLSEVKLPEGFTWMNPSQVIEQSGNIKYKVRYTPNDTNNYEIVEDIDVTINVNKIAVKIPTKVDKTYTYNGANQYFELTNLDGNEIKITGNVRKDAGEQTVTVSLLNENYVWEDGTTKDITFKFVINKMQVKIPTRVDKTYIYTGSDQYLLLMNFDDSKMKITGNVRKDAGEQTATVSLLNSNYVWTDGTTKNITFNFKIEKADPNYVSSSDYVGVYDGNAHSINLKVNTTDYNVKYSVNNTNYDLSAMPTFKEIGEYTVNYKITKNNYKDVMESKKVCIYGVQKLDSTLELRNNILVIKNYNNSFQDICNRIKLFATSHSYNHYDKNKVLTNNAIANTGDSIKININNLKEYEYAISVLGDVNGDGKISALDYVKIKNHIMKTNLISSDVYLISADVNDDGKISALDYVRIKNRIMNGGV